MPCYIQPIKPANKAEFQEWRNLGYTGTWDDYSRAKQANAGGTMFLCGDLGAHCAECAAVGDLLCDFPVSEGKTCDRPICEDHGHEIGPNLHYCSAHHQMWSDFKNRGGVDDALRNVIAFKGEK